MPRTISIEKFLETLPENVESRPVYLQNCFITQRATFYKDKTQVYMFHNNSDRPGASPTDFYANPSAYSSHYKNSWYIGHISSNRFNASMTAYNMRIFINTDKVKIL